MRTFQSIFFPAIAVLLTIILPIRETTATAAGEAESALNVILDTKCLAASVKGKMVLLSVKATPIACSEKNCKPFEESLPIRISDFTKERFSAQVTLSLGKITKALKTPANNTLVSVGLCEKIGANISCGTPELQQVFRMRGNHFESTYGNRDVALRISNDAKIAGGHCNRS